MLDATTNDVPSDQVEVKSYPTLVFFTADGQGVCLRQLSAGRNCIDRNPACLSGNLPPPLPHCHIAVLPYNGTRTQRDLVAFVRKNRVSTKHAATDADSSAEELARAEAAAEAAQDEADDEEGAKDEL